MYSRLNCFSAAVAIADKILNEGQPAVDAYLKFLSSGGSDFPVELLKIAGVDLSKPDAILAGLKVFENTLNEFERMMKA